MIQVQGSNTHVKFTQKMEKQYYLKVTSELIKILHTLFLTDKHFLQKISFGESIWLKIFLKFIVATYLKCVQNKIMLQLFLGKLLQSVQLPFI